MTTAPATLADLADALDTCPADLPVKLRTPEGVIGTGYHVTELKLAQIQSIDCGGRLASWTEAQLQVLDGRDGEPLVAGKIAAILRRSAAAVSGLATAPLSYELSPGNRGLGRFRLAGLSREGDVLMLDLSAEQALCKPAKDFGTNRAAPAASVGCCGAAPMAATGCCG